MMNIYLYIGYIIEHSNIPVLRTLSDGDDRDLKPDKGVGDKNGLFVLDTSFGNIIH